MQCLFFCVMSVLSIAQQHFQIGRDVGRRLFMSQRQTHAALGIEDVGDSGVVHRVRTLRRHLLEEHLELLGGGGELSALARSAMKLGS
jgi:hypothetical protein